MKRFLACILTLHIAAGPVIAEEATATAASQTTTPALSPAQLDDLVAPIALYPDTLLSQVLVATTYPLELVQANQWIQQHPDLKGQDLTQAAQHENWDPSVQALVVFPDVMKRLNEDVAWTTRLGNAFLANQAGVMDAVQRQRGKAQQNGKLTSTDQQKVTTTTESGQKIVEIQPADPQVIYVPVYDPGVIWGPPLYYPYPVWYYPAPPRPGIWFWFGAPVVLGVSFWGCCGWGGWGWHPGWRRHEVIVNNYFIHRYNFHNRVVNVRGETPWRHEPFHRLGVAYPTRQLGVQYRAPQRAVIRPEQLREHFHQREIRSGTFNRNHSAFGGVEGGTAARVHSDRGYSSLSHTRSAPAVPATPGSSRTPSRGHSWGGGHTRGGSDHGGGGHR